VRDRIEEDPRLASPAAPALVVEESPLVWLPAPDPASPWPRPESWLHAARLVFASWPVGRRPVVTGSTVEEVAAQLAGPRAVAFSSCPAGWSGLCAAGLSTAGLAADRAAVAAEDLHRAAVAWEGDPAAFWVAERVACGLSAEEAAARARDRGLEVRPPCIRRSGVDASPERGGGRPAVRLGLEVLAARSVAEVVVRERARGGAYGSAMELARRVRRRGVEWRPLVRLVVASGLELFDEPRGSLLRSFADHLLAGVRAGFAPDVREAARGLSRSSSGTWTVPAGS
jgi:hypothetical protein